MNIYHYSGKIESKKSDNLIGIGNFYNNLIELRNCKNDTPII